MSSNPFHYNLPVSRTNFYGRQSLIDALLRDLTGPRADSWAVIGGRRFGKSSLLKVIEQSLFDRLAARELGERAIFPLNVNIQRYPNISERHIYAYILDDLHQALHLTPQLQADIDQTRLHKTLSQEPEELSYRQFEKILRNLQQILEQQEIPWRLVLLLDEVESVTDYDWSETLFNQLRAAIYDGPLADMMALVLTGSAKVMKVRQSGSPLLNAVKIEHLACLAPTAIDQLIAQGAPVPEPIIAAIHAQCGGHPYIAQYLLHHLWQGDLSQATLASVEQKARQMCRDCHETFTGWYNAIGVGGQAAYGRLIDTDGWVHERDLFPLAPDMQHGLDALQYHGLVAYDMQTRTYQRGSDLFSQWATKQQASPSATEEESTASDSKPHIHIETAIFGDEVHQDKIEGDKAGGSIHSTTVT